jgi:hypothetical protein
MRIGPYELRPEVSRCQSSTVNNFESVYLEIRD